LVPVLKARGKQYVLDLGCGVGRHALLFAEHGFAVEAIDGAAAGLDFACREAAARGLQLSVRQADADALDGALLTMQDKVEGDLSERRIQVARTHFRRVGGAAHLRDQALARGRAEGEDFRITLTPPGTSQRTDKPLLLQVLGISEAEYTARFCHPVQSGWRLTCTRPPRIEGRLKLRRGLSTARRKFGNRPFL
jgi:hypothetical protein